MEVTLHRIARKYLERLNGPVKDQLKAALEGLEKDPPAGDIVPLTERKGWYRLKTGGYRILYHFEGASIFVTHIEPRGQAYAKKFKSR